MSPSHNPDLDEQPPIAPEPEKEVRELNPFVRMDRGFATIDPTDPNSVVFEDFSLRVVPSDAPDQMVDTEIPTVPKGLSVLAPASSSELPPPTEPTKSEDSAQDELPFPMPTPSLPSPSVAEPGDGKLNLPVSG